MSIPAHISALVLDTTRCRCTRLKALTTAAAGLVTPDNVSSAAGDLLTAICGIPNQKPLLVDCTGIVGLSNYALHGLHKFADATHNTLSPLVFFNASEHLAEDIYRELPTRKEHPKSDKQIPQQTSSSKSVIYLPVGSRNISVAPLIQQAEAVDRKRMQDIIRDTFHENALGTPAPLSSTPFLASGVYNARHIICEPDQFNWTVLHLEQHLDELIPDWDPSRHCLLSGSLRAAPFAAALAFMKTLPRAVEIHDHFGPNPILLEEHDLGPSRHSLEYIYIGDFMIGGTELKIAYNWAAWRKCRLVKALVLGTLWEKKR